MRTDDLVNALAADGARRSPPAWARVLPAIGATLVTVAAFAAWLNVRPDFAQALTTPRFLAKLGLLIALGVAALGAARLILRPASSAGPWGVALLAPPALLALCVIAELATTPTTGWARLAVGTNAMRCVTLIPFLSILPLAGILATLRSGATDHPIAAGALAGLLAAAIGGLLYGAMCTDDSPLFVALWYPLAIGIVGGAGAVLGRFTLRW